MMIHTPQLDFPLKGLWKVLKSPGHHRYAYDFAAASLNGKHFSASWTRLLFGKTEVNGSYSWAAPVYSPVGGEIVEASDGWPDKETFNLCASLVKVFAMGVFQGGKAKEDLRIFAGNYVLIKSGDHYVFMAHLRRDSLKVESGQSISRGQQIANIGNSGNSAAPHLHLQVNNDADLFGSDIVEFEFRRYERWTGAQWETLHDEVPEKGWLLRCQP